MVRVHREDGGIQPFAFHCSNPLVRVWVLHRNVQRFRGGLVFKARRLCVSLNSRLESNKEEEEG